MQFKVQYKIKMVCFLLIIFTFFSMVTVVNSVGLNNGYYIVKQGDTLSSIAKYFGVVVKQIVDWNHLPTPSIIFPGKLLKIAEDSIPKKPPISNTADSVSINFVDTDIRDVLSVVALELKKNILYIGAPMRFSIRAAKVAKSDLLDVVVSTAGGMVWVTSGDLIIVGSKGKISADFKNNLLFTGIKLKYITAPELIIQSVKLSIDVKTITLKETLNKIWIEGRPSEISRFYQLLDSLDKRENFPDIGTGVDRTMFYKQYNLKYITAKVFQIMLGQFNIPVLFATSESNPMICFVSGPASTLNEFEGVLSKLDVKENTSNPSSGDLVGVTKYVLRYISYSDAENLLINSKMGITVMNLTSYPKSIFFFGAKSFRDEALRLLQSIDTKGEIIKEIVDYATSTTKLASRRNLICNISGLSVSNFVISDDVDRDPKVIKYILYYRGTEAEIAKIRKVIALIDAPLGGQ